MGSVTSIRRTLVTEDSPGNECFASLVEAIAAEHRVSTEIVKQPRMSALLGSRHTAPSPVAVPANRWNKESVVKGRPGRTIGERADRCDPNVV